MTKRKKLNKQARTEKRIEHANNWTDGFNHGFILGYQVGVDEGMKVHDTNEEKREDEVSVLWKRTNYS